MRRRINMRLTAMSLVLVVTLALAPTVWGARPVGPDGPEIPAPLPSDGEHDGRPEAPAQRPEAQSQIKTATVHLPGHSKPTSVTYEIIDGLALFEGDIILGPVDEEGRLIRPTAIAREGDEYRWPNGRVPYTVAADVSDLGRQHIDEAINHWEAETGIRFVERSGHSDYVAFVVGSQSNVCSSAVGRTGGRQVIRLTNRGDCPRGTLIHEIGHTIGLWHEQSREDRDEHIEILWENIEEGRTGQFSQHVADGFDIGAYDYGSIMHYHAYAFSKNGQRTIQTIPPGISIGQRCCLSDGDIAAVATLYGGFSLRVTITGATLPSNPAYRVVVQRANGEVVARLTNSTTLTDLNAGDYTVAAPYWDVGGPTKPVWKVYNPEPRSQRVAIPGNAGTATVTIRYTVHDISDPEPSPPRSLTRSKPSELPVTLALAPEAWGARSSGPDGPEIPANLPEEDPSPRSGPYSAQPDIGFALDICLDTETRRLTEERLTDYFASERGLVRSYCVDGTEKIGIWIPPFVAALEHAQDRETSLRAGLEDVDLQRQPGESFGLAILRSGYIGDAVHAAWAAQPKILNNKGEPDPDGSVVLRHLSYQREGDNRVVTEIKGFKRMPSMIPDLDFTVNITDTVQVGTGEDAGRLVCDSSTDFDVDTDGGTIDFLNHLAVNLFLGPLGIAHTLFPFAADIFDDPLAPAVERSGVGCSMMALFPSRLDLDDDGEQALVFSYSRLQVGQGNSIRAGGSVSVE